MKLNEYSNKFYQDKYYKTELLTSKERVLTVLNVDYSMTDNKFKNSIPKEFLEDIEISNKINELES
jgi:hypothetical protein